MIKQEPKYDENFVDSFCEEEVKVCFEDLGLSVYYPSTMPVAVHLDEIRIQIKKLLFVEICNFLFVSLICLVFLSNVAVLFSTNL